VGRGLKVCGVIAGSLVCTLAAGTSPAPASVTLGQVGAPGLGACEGFDLAQPTVASGNSYVLPGKGRITSWTTYGGPSPGTQLTMKIFRLTAAPATYQAVGHSGPQPVTAGGTAGNTFAANIPVKPGDVLGLNATSYCLLASPGEQYLQYLGDLTDGDSKPFTTGSGARLNIQAVFDPDNAFSVGGTKRNKKKGNATVTLDLPNPGTLAASGTGAKVAAAAKSVPAGFAKLLVKAKGKKLRTLNDTGKVKLSLSVTYTPSGGDAATQSLKVKLKKKL
jgi:hypothetical protein